jgi:predicted N-acetyltransferase YhbS
MGVDVALTIRPARPVEADDVASLVRRAMAEYRASDPVVHEGYVAYSLDPAHAAGAEQLVAEAEGRLVGAVLFLDRVRDRPGWPSSAATFWTLVVDPSARRMGIGARLVGACIDQARASGARHLIIDTMPFLTSAGAFYGPFGFERWPDGDWDGTPVLRSILGRRDVPRTMLSAWRLVLSGTAPEFGQ